MSSGRTLTTIDLPGRPDVPVAEVQRRIVRVLMLSQVLGGVGLGAGIAVGALLAEDLLGTTALAGLPTALFAIGSALGALAVGRLSDRSGRRVGLGAGYVAAALGSAAVVLSAVIESPPLFILGMILYGVGTATNLQARYAGADLADGSSRGRAVSAILVSTTLGAVIGPNLVDVMGAVARAVSVPELAGPFILTGLAFAGAAAVLVALLHPDPLVTAKALDLRPSRVAQAGALATGVGVSTRPSWSPREGLLVFGAATMVITQIVMAAIMTMTPIHMRDHGHALAATGLVISVHVACMYLPSPLSGWLADRFGQRPVIMAAGGVLLLAGIVAALAPPESVAWLMLALGLLGLGWNMGLVSGTTLVTEATPVADRARTQGTVDLLVGLAGSVGGISSGVMVSAAGYSQLSVAGAILALVLIPLMFGTGRVRQAAPA